MMTYRVYINNEFMPAEEYSFQRGVLTFVNRRLEGAPRLLLERDVVTVEELEEDTLVRKSSYYPRESVAPGEALEWEAEALLFP